MSDISDVENALVNAISASLFPLAYYVPYTVATSSVTGISCRLYRGWPIDQQLNNDLLAGVTNISIFAAEGVARNATRYLRHSTTTSVSQATSTMTATLSGSVVTFAGTGSISEVMGIGIRNFGRGYGYSTRLTLNQTPTQIAAVFAANLAGATSSGPSLTVAAPSASIVVEYGGDVTELVEVHRNEQVFMVTVWSPTVAIRDQLCSFIDPQLIWIDHLYFPDGSCSEPVIGAGTCVDDVIQKEFMWRRTLYYSIKYPTEYSIVRPIMALGKDTVQTTLEVID